MSDIVPSGLSDVVHNGLSDIVPSGLSDIVPSGLSENDRKSFWYTEDTPTQENSRKKTCFHLTILLFQLLIGNPNKITKNSLLSHVFNII